MRTLFEGKKLLMETFYRHMRKKLDILVENGAPVGVRWDFETDNT